MSTLWCSNKLDFLEFMTTFCLTLTVETSVGLLGGVVMHMLRLWTLTAGHGGGAVLQHMKDDDSKAELARVDGSRA